MARTPKTKKMNKLLEQYQNVPRDEQDARFVKSFSLQQVEEFTQFFHHFGFVVVDNVFSQEECQATIDDIWSILEAPVSHCFKLIIFPSTKIVSSACFETNQKHTSTFLLIRRALLDITQYFPNEHY